MARNKTITLTEEHLKLISYIKFEKFLLDDKEHINELKNMIGDLVLYDSSSSKNKKDSLSIEQENERTLKNIDNFNPNARFAWGIDQYGLFGGSYVLDDVAMILGYFDKAIPGTEEDPLGRRYPVELEKKMYDYYEFILDNLDDIITMLFYFNDKGGLKPGTYEYDEYRWVFKG